MDLWAPGVNLRPSLLAAGTTDRELRRLRRTGNIVAVRPGAYVAAEELDGAVAAHLHAARAAAAQLGPGSVLSHITAALLHGLPLWVPPLDQVHATRDRRSGSRRNRHLHLHAAALEPDEVTESDGLLLTTVLRTLLDIARFLPFEQALVPVDAALHKHVVTTEQLREALERAAHRAGNTAARQVLAFARPGAASPGETRSRVAIHRAGLPAPELQKELYTADGRLLGQVDFWWEELGTAGEFDGRTKYGRDLKPGQDPATSCSPRSCARTPSAPTVTAWPAGRGASFAISAPWRAGSRAGDGPRRPCVLGAEVRDPARRTPGLRGRAGTIPVGPVVEWATVVRSGGFCAAGPTAGHARARRHSPVRGAGGWPARAGR